MMMEHFRRVRLSPDTMPGFGGDRSTPMITHSKSGLGGGTPGGGGGGASGDGGAAGGAASGGSGGGGASAANGGARDLDTDIDKEVRPQIKLVDQGLGSGKHLENWKRKPNTNGTGASHCRSFHCKLTGDSLENLDRQINEWLDHHPEYEVKLVTTTVGEWTGKLREPNLIVQVWV